MTAVVSAILSTLVSVLILVVTLTAFALLLPPLNAVVMGGKVPTSVLGRIVDAYERYMDFWIAKERQWQRD
jgi:hypothetical protein